MANNVLNQLSYAKALSNTGLPTCFFNPKNIEGCILIPKGTTYTQTQQLTLPTVLAAAAINDNIALRIFPIKRFIDFEDQTEDNPTQTFGYGGKEKKKSDKANMLGISCTIMVVWHCTPHCTALTVNKNFMMLSLSITK